ncbi:MAG: helix-turn-helix transcriptional regulator [Gammaproteobacteria bacterium]
MFEFEDIVKSASVYLAAKDKNLKYIYCNEKVACGLGLDSPKQIVGKTDHDLFTDEVAHMYRAGDTRVLNGGTLLNAREIQPHTDKTIQILTTKNQLRNNSNILIGVAISFIDITGLTCKFNSDIMQYDRHRRRYTFQIGNTTEFFTRREYDVFKNILAGFTAKKIAKQLTLSPRTVECYIEKIKHKFQCTRKNHIIEAAMRLGILQQNIINNNV